ncbi:MAG: gas vesicle protein GvpD [Candidatus Methanofastidiosia archaeon]
MIAIPQEMMSFLNKKGGRTLLIKGRAGTGKTILSLSLIRACHNNGIYLSTRVRPEDLYQDCPWIERQLKPSNIIDATNPLREKIVAQSRDFSEVVKYGSKEDFLVALYERVDQLEQPVVVIDSWDAVISHLHTSQERMEKAVVELCKETHTNLILVGEHPEETQLDYLMDGVVELKRTQMDNRRVRVIHMTKLRGVEIHQPQYLFTLEKGMFRSFSRFESAKIEHPKKWVPIPDPDGFFSTGCRDLDNILKGGFKRGSLTLFEEQLDVSRSAEGYLWRCCLFNFLAQTRGVVLVAGEGVSPQKLKELSAPYVGEDTWNTYVRIGVYGIEESDEPYIIPVTGTSDQRYNIWESVVKELKEETGNPIQDYTALDTLEFRSGVENTIKAMGGAVRDLKTSGDLQIALIKPGLEVSKQVINLAENYFRFQSIYGTAVVYGVHPETGFYVIEIDGSQGYPQVKLVPIV